MGGQWVHFSCMDVVQNVLITRNTTQFTMPVGFRGRLAFCPVQFKKGRIRGDLQPPPSAQQSRDNSVRSLPHGA